MQVDLIDSKGLKNKFRAVIPSKTIDISFSKKLSELAVTLKIPGFRPGKVPARIVKQRHGKQVFNEVVEQEILNTWKSTMEKKKIRPSIKPKINIEKPPKEGEDIAFTIEVELLPDIKLIDLKALKFTRYNSEVSKDEISQGLKTISLKNKSFTTVRDGIKSKNGDLIVIDFEGKIDGKPFKNGAAENFSVEIGSGQMMPGFEKQLVGLVNGQSRDIKTTFPKDFFDPDLKGKEANFECKVKEIKIPADPLEGEELAKSLGMPDFKTLNEAVKNQLEKNYQDVSFSRIKRDILDLLQNKHNFSLPEEMVENEFNAIWSNFERDKKKGILDEEDKGKTEKVLKKDYKDLAQRRVKLGLILQEIGNTNKIKVEKNEIDAAIQKEAELYPESSQKIREFYGNNPDATSRLEGPIFEDKVINFIIASSKVENKLVSREELLGYKQELDDKNVKKQKPLNKSGKKKESVKPKMSKNSNKKINIKSKEK